MQTEDRFALITRGTRNANFYLLANDARSLACYLANGFVVRAKYSVRGEWVFVSGHINLKW